MPNVIFSHVSDFISFFFNKCSKLLFEILQCKSSGSVVHAFSCIVTVGNYNNVFYLFFHLNAKHENKHQDAKQETDL